MYVAYSQAKAVNYYVTDRTWPKGTYGGGLRVVLPGFRSMARRVQGDCAPLRSV